MRLEEFGRPLVLREMAIPPCGEGEVLVRVRAAGVCGTDLKIQQGKVPVKKLPLIPGHEFSGVVTKTGSAVTGFAEGDEVLVSFYIPCGACKLCFAGRHTVCENLRGRLGFELDGGFAEFVAVPAASLIRKPRVLSFAEAAILSDAVATPYHALVKRAQVREGDWTVMVGGGGGLGLHAVQIARTFKNRVIGVDVSNRKLELMRAYGAEEVIDATVEPAWSARVLEITDGRGADNVIDFVSSVETVRNSVDALRKGGKLVLIGYSTNPSIDSGKTVLNELEIIGSRAATKGDIEECLGLVLEGSVKAVIDDILLLEEANEALSRLREGRTNGRLVLEVSR